MLPEMFASRFFPFHMALAQTAKAHCSTRSAARLDRTMREPRRDNSSCSERPTGIRQKLPTCTVSGLVVAQETEQSHKLNEALVKQLTGGDPLKGRRMNEDFWEFNPTHKLVLCTNHKPRVSGSDHAIWRRIKLIPFTVRFDGDRRDKSMPDKLKAERQGILAWIVRGAVQWAAEGLHDPETVRIATAEYQSSEDVIGRFAAERCITGDGEVRAKDLRDKLEEWCALEGFDTPSSRAVGEWIEQHDDFGSRKSNGTIYTGLRLIDDS